MGVLGWLSYLFAAGGVVFAGLAGYRFVEYGPTAPGIRCLLFSVVAIIAATVINRFHIARKTGVEYKRLSMVTAFLFFSLLPVVGIFMASLAGIRLLQGRVLGFAEGNRYKGFGHHDGSQIGGHGRPAGIAYLTMALLQLGAGVYLVWYGLNAGWFT